MSSPDGPPSDDDRHAAATAGAGASPSGPRASGEPPPPTPAAPPESAGARALVAVAELAGRLPLPVLRGFGALLGVLVAGGSARYRRKLVDNLRRAGYPGFGWGLRAAAGAGTMAAELPWIWRRSPEALGRYVRCDDLAVIEKAESAGRGILFLTPHLGAFEMTARWYARRAPITVIFREPHKALLRPLVRRVREVGRMRAVPASLSGVRALLRALRAREAVGLLPDHVPGAGDGEWAPFFGEPAWTMTLPQQLVRSTGAAVVFAVGERIPGGWRIHLSRLDEAPTPQHLNARIEALVRRWPAQYLWGYNRYKRPAGADRARRAMN